MIGKSWIGTIENHGYDRKMRRKVIGKWWIWWIWYDMMTISLSNRMTAPYVCQWNMEVSRVMRIIRPKKAGWFLETGKSQSHMDNDWGYPHLWNPFTAKRWEVHGDFVHVLINTLLDVAPEMGANRATPTWWFIPRIVRGLVHPSFFGGHCPHLSH